MRGFGRFLKWGSIALLAIAVVIAGAGLLYRGIAQRRVAAATAITGPEGIESLEPVTLGGVRQWILLRGHDRTRPVLLFLHGGPGSPLMPVARSFGSRLEEHFVVVHWDQRASGKSACEAHPPDSLSIERYVADALELVDLLRERFGRERVYLLGHSWGSVLGTLLARDHPDRLHAYVGMGQVVNMRVGERISYDFVVRRARETGNRAALEQLAGLAPPYEEDPGQLLTQRTWLERFGGAVHEGNVLRLFLPGLASPEYSLLDLVAYARGTFELPARFWPEMLAIDFVADAPRLDVPVLFLVGRHDYNTPFELVERYHQILDAPRKEIVWFERSAHSPNLEEPDRFQDVLISRLVAELAQPLREGSASVPLQR